MKQPLVSVVIPTFNRKDKLARLIGSIIDSDYKNIEIIAIDDASTDGTYEFVKARFPNIKLFRNHKERFVAESRNIGTKYAKGEYIFFIDDDNIIEKNTILELVKYIKEYKNFIVSPLMLYYSSPSIIWCAGGIINKITYIPHYIYKGKELQDLKIPKDIDCEYNPNAFLMTRNMIQKVGYFDEKSFPISWEETDFFKRAKIKGFFARTVSSSRIWHDVPINEHYHITNIRSYYRGKTRINFYLKYAKWRILFSILDVLFFVFFVLKSKINTKSKGSAILSYVKGMSDGLMSK